VGGDSFLDVVRGSALVLEGKFVDAKIVGDRAINAEVGLKPAYDMLLAASVLSKRHADTVRWLRELERRFKVHVDSMIDQPDFEPFRKSPEYRQWMAQRKPM
jgi:hypothetical protein